MWCSTRIGADLDLGLIRPLVGVNIRPSIVAASFLRNSLTSQCNVKRLAQKQFMPRQRCGRRMVIGEIRNEQETEASEVH